MGRRVGAGEHRRAGRLAVRVLAAAGGESSPLRSQAVQVGCLADLVGARGPRTMAPTIGALPLPATTRSGTCAPPTRCGWTATTCLAPSSMEGEHLRPPRP